MSRAEEFKRRSRPPSHGCQEFDRADALRKQRHVVQPDSGFLSEINLLPIKQVFGSRQLGLGILHHVAVNPSCLVINPSAFNRLTGKRIKTKNRDTCQSSFCLFFDLFDS